MPEPQTPDETPRDEPTEETARMTTGDPLAGGAGGGEPPPPPPPTEPQPKRLLRTRSDRTLLGVCGGVGRYLGVDTTIVRVLTVALVLFGGAGLLLYLAAALLMPEEPVGAAGAGDAVAATPTTGNRILVIVGAVVLAIVALPFVLPPLAIVVGLAIPLGILALLGLAIWAVLGGSRDADGAAGVLKAAALGIGVLFACGLLFLAAGWASVLGGDWIVAGLVIAAGIALIAGAFVRPVRWLIPAGLSVALAVGFVQAANIDVGDGGVGAREYRPSALADIRPQYDMGVGELVVDLRDVDLPAGDHPLEMDIGIGRALLLVDEDVCVASRADVGMGAVEVFDHDSDGVDVEWEELPRPASGNPRLVLDADVGMGVVQVRSRDDDELGDHWGRDRDHDDLSGLDVGENAGCAGVGSAS